VIWILGSDHETGTGTFEAKGTNESRIDLNLSGGTRSDVRNRSNGTPVGAWKKDASTATQYAEHNCWTDAAWFFMPLSSLVQTANPNFVFKYIGQEQHIGVNTQHIQVFQSNSDFPPGQPLSTMDFYLDPTSFIPLSVSFTTHPDANMNINILTGINFANYQVVSAVRIPFHFQHMLNGSVDLDITVTNAAMNTGLPDSLFTLP
jgi:hypothetical protein